MHPHPLDHCVLPTVSLAAARARLRALGFTVAPDAFHPFGTGNCCVFFQDGSYLEPLAVVDARAAHQAETEDNVFIVRDRMFRDAGGKEGFSALVLGTQDAEADHARFADAGISAGPMLGFSRAFGDAHGTKSEASFRLAFASPPASSSFVFTCQRVKVPAVDRSSLQRHDNGVAGIVRILATAANPDEYGFFLARFCNAEPAMVQGGCLEFALAGAAVLLLPPEEARRVYGIESNSAGLRFHGIVFRAPDLRSMCDRLVAAGIGHHMHEKRLVVPEATGQGAAFLFEEHPS